MQSEIPEHPLLSAASFRVTRKGDKRLFEEGRLPHGFLTAAATGGSASVSEGVQSSSGFSWLSAEETTLMIPGSPLEPVVFAQTAE